MAKILLAGESWISSTTEYKGYDSFTSTKLEIGCEYLLSSLRSLNHEIVHLLAHDVPEKFPWTMAELNEYDVVILSDIGSNSFMLSNSVFSEGKPSVNRLQLLKEWVQQGGSLMMAGGYLSFGGFEGKGHYHGTAIEEILPVTIAPYDDRVECPQGVVPMEHSTSIINSGLGTFPIVLGYQQVVAKKNSNILMTIGEKDPFLVTGEYEKGRTMAYMTDIAPHWASQEFMDWKNYGAFFSRCIKWLTNEL